MFRVFAPILIIVIGILLSFLVFYSLNEKDDKNREVTMGICSEGCSDQIKQLYKGCCLDCLANNNCTDTETVVVIRGGEKLIKGDD